jgi:hypothetical protein
MSKKENPRTVGKITRTPDGRTVNEWLEALGRLKRDNAVKYAREVSAPINVLVEKYEELKV